MSAINKAVCTWEVDDIVNVTKCIYSSVFYFPNSDKIGLRLCLVPTLRTDAFTDSLAVYLEQYCYEVEEEEVPICYRISVLDVEKTKVHEQAFQDTLGEDPGPLFTMHYFTRLYILNPDNELLIDGKVTFHCEVEIIKKELGIKDALLQNYESLLESGDFTDVIFKIGDQEVKAHKAILSSQSQVFAAMFKHECKEKQDNVVEITDVSVDVFKELLRFLYCSKAPNLQQFAPELLVAADKYQLIGLKSLCTQFLTSKLDVNSVVEILLLADLHQEVDLKIKCIEFINEQSIQVMATDGWKRFMVSKPFDLLVDLYEDCLERFAV